MGLKGEAKANSKIIVIVMKQYEFSAGRNPKYPGWKNMDSQWFIISIIMICISSIAVLVLFILFLSGYFHEESTLSIILLIQGLVLFWGPIIIIIFLRIHKHRYKYQDFTKLSISIDDVMQKITLKLAKKDIRYEILTKQKKYFSTLDFVIKTSIFEIWIWEYQNKNYIESLSFSGSKNEHIELIEMIDGLIRS